MKRVTKRQTFKDLPPLRLYRADLEAITELIAEGGNSPVTLASANYEFDSLDEMRNELGPVINDIVIQGPRLTGQVFRLRTVPRRYSAAWRAMTAQS
jgi:hypothetical protein